MSPKNFSGLVLAVSVVLVGCSERATVLKDDPVVVCYSSVRGASPQLVDYFVIVLGSGPVEVSHDPNTPGQRCFIVGKNTEDLFRRELTDILVGNGWDSLTSIAKVGEDTPFRRLTVVIGDVRKDVEFFEQQPPDRFLHDKRYKRFRTIVSELRVLGETFGSRGKVVSGKIVDNLEIPLVAK